MIGEAGSQDEGSVFPSLSRMQFEGTSGVQDPNISMSGGPDAGSSCRKTKAVKLRGYYDCGV